MINLQIDLGHYNIKTNIGIVFKSTFKKGKEINPFGEDIIFVENEYYTMEKGSFDNTNNKALKNYKPNLCYAIAKSIDTTEADINLMLGIPLDSLGAFDLFKEELLHQTLEFEYNKIPYRIYINDVKAVGEGISSYYTLSEKQRSEDLLIVDIGGRTTNVVTFEKGKLTHKFTIPLGTIHLFSRIGTRFNNDEGSNKVVEEIERLIDNGYIKNTEIEEKQFLNDIMNYIEGKVDRRTYKNYYTGGGSLRLKRLIEEYLSPSGIVMDNPLFTNVKGNEIIANMIWGD